LRPALHHHDAIGDLLDCREIMADDRQAKPYCSWRRSTQFFQHLGLDGHSKPRPARLRDPTKAGWRTMDAANRDPLPLTA